MYCEGVCPDFSYSFCGKPPPTASLIIKYIEKNMLPINTEIVNNENKISITEINENKRKDTVHALRTAMNCKIENKDKDKDKDKDKNKDKDSQAVKTSGLSQNDYLKHCQKVLNSLQAKVAVSKTPCKYVRYDSLHIRTYQCISCVV